VEGQARSPQTVLELVKLLQTRDPGDTLIVSVGLLQTLVLNAADAERDALLGLAAERMCTPVGGELLRMIEEACQLHVSSD
jgi:hypothetical protein